VGLRGPKRAGAVVQLLHGETRPSRVNRAEPDLPAPRTLAPPAGLTGAGLKEWQRLAATLRDAGVLTDADLTAFEDYCRALSDLRRYEAKAARVGVELSLAKGYAGAVLKLRGQVAQLRGHLGLTPVSRFSVKARKRAPTGTLAQFLGGRHGDHQAVS
jgi:P27 family predicted phage terminase small subunit